MSSASIDGMSYLAGQSQSAGSGCGASSNAVTYDSRGNVLSKDDFSGARTCYAYDASDRETARIEGLANTASCSTMLAASSLPAGARKTTTTWHPDWRLPTVVSLPLKKTTIVYNGQGTTCTTATSLPGGKALPVVCQRVEQALLSNGTVDTSVTASTSTYTYDASGRKLTEVDPSSKTTTYAYYTDTAFTGTYDPSFENVTLLLRGNGPNGSTSIEDNAPIPHVLTAYGNAQVSTSQSKYGGASLAFDGTGDYLSTPNSADFNFGTGSFTVELFARFANTTGSQVLLTNYQNPTYGWTLQLYNGKLIFNCTGDGIDLQGVSSPAAGTWYHVAVTRTGTTMRLFINGALDATSTNSQDCTSTSPLAIGNLPPYSAYMNGHLDEVRITKGTARYTATFTPPSQEFPHTGLTSIHTGHTLGDLQSVTNAAGHVTEYNLYDPAGRVRRMTDAKGVVTDITYAPRGWVDTVTVTPPGGTARVTTYTYDDAGQMTAVALPDGTSLGYRYDAAHRLDKITDARCNSVTYILDNSGNRTGEEVRDSGGTLRRSIARSFDALNRLQQVTGGPR
jgi:YD repeat-containing protein